MKIAVIGNGRTGYEVEKALPYENIVGPFNSTYPVSVAKLKKADFGIVFVPPTVFRDLKDTLIESGIPMIIGTTGVEWDESLIKELKEKKLTWVFGANFSLGMQIARKLLEKTNTLMKAFPQFSSEIHEIHHVKKLDAPSGTALMWNNLIGGQTDIFYERRGDVKGFHKLTLSNGHETIDIAHDVIDRKIFADGAIWCAHFLSQNSIKPGLYNFNEIVESYLEFVEEQNGEITFNNEIMDSNRNTDARERGNQLSGI